MEKLVQQINKLLEENNAMLNPILKVTNAGFTLSVEVIEKPAPQDSPKK